MKIEIPLRPRRHEFVAAATAIYVPSRDLNLLFAQCARLGLDPTGRLFDVAGGFLLELQAPSTDPAPGVVRLRALKQSLYLPVDSELVPGLLDDEASGLVRDWGLVFLPGGRTLFYDRHAPIELTELLRAQPEAGQGPRPRRGARFPRGAGLPTGSCRLAWSCRRSRRNRCTTRSRSWCAAARDHPKGARPSGRAVRRRVGDRHKGR